MEYQLYSVSTSYLTILPLETLRVRDLLFFSGDSGSEDSWLESINAPALGRLVFVVAVEESVSSS